MPVEIKRLSDLNLKRGGHGGQPMNVCVVSSEFLGPIKNGGIATATSALARRLVSDGHRVTLLYTYVGLGTPVSGDKPWPQWVDALAAEGIALEYIHNEGDYRDWREASWLVKDFFGQGDFDLVYFNDHYGSGYYSLLAKRAGLAPFCNQLHCVITHGTMEWVFSINDQYACRVSDLEWMGLERRSVELADVVIGPSTYLLREYERYGWRLPLQTFHQPYPIFQNPMQVDDSRLMPIRELVFFGRLEVRKGLWLFCEALDRLAQRFPKTDVTFLGRATEFSGISSALQIVNRSTNWPFRVRLLTDFDQERALSYLRGSGRLAVMPSVADNSPCVVYECMEAGIPFITTSGSGADELVDPNCWNDMMVEPNVASLAGKLASALEHGARLGRPRFDPAENLATWSAWHRYLAEHRAELIEAAGSIPSASSQAVAVSDATKPALIVVIDNGNCKLSLLLDNLCSHMRRFSGRAAYLLLTARRGELQDAIADVFGDSEAGPASLCILDSRTIDEARRLICASVFVFFLDAETEMLTSFFVSALNTLQRRQPAIVSCAVASRRNSTDNGIVEELPCGDLPALAELGEPIGGSVWAVSATSLAAELSSLELYDPQADEFTPSAILGQRLMQSCRTSNAPIHVFPLVGAVETREPGEVRRGRGLKDLRHSATTLGLKSSAYGGGAAWFAMHSFGAYMEHRPPIPVDCAAFLQPQHPLREIEARTRGLPEDEDLASLAAALGRAELSLQIEASKGPYPGRARHLMDVATRSIRQRPGLDLVELLAGGEAIEFGQMLAPEAAGGYGGSTQSRPSQTLAKKAARTSGNGAAGMRPDTNGAIASAARIYFDGKRLHVRRNKIRAAANLRIGGPGRLFFFDVPLCGNATLAATLVSSNSSNPAFVRMKAIDQRSGEGMCVASDRLVPGGVTELTVPLHEVFGRVAIAFEFSGAERMEVTLEAIRIR